jgi:hypothetical protein
MKTNSWFKRIRDEFTGENYKKWLLASYRKKKLEEVSLMTGDLLLVKTWEPFEAGTTEEDWNQVAMVVRDPSARVREAYGLTSPDTLFILDTDHPKEKDDVTLTPLRKWMEIYTGLFGKDIMYVYRKLELPDRKPQDHENFPELENWLLTLKGRIYNRTKEKTLTRIFQSLKKQDDPRFTAELISETYREMGLFQQQEYTPEPSENLTSVLLHSWDATNLSMKRGAALMGALRLVIR